MNGRGKVVLQSNNLIMTEMCRPERGIKRKSISIMICAL